MHLPTLLFDIAQECSVASAIKVAEAKGGTTAYIPGTIKGKPDHWLVSAVGEVDAEIICEMLAIDGKGSSHLIPMATTGQRARTRALIQKMVDEKTSADKIARAIGVHKRTVYRHKIGKQPLPLFPDE